jgi:hypothetical protein
LDAIDGSIDYYFIEDGGVDYTTATVVIDGDGQDATAEAIIFDGSIIYINITNRGSGYHYATVTISGDGSGASVKAMISPSGGHGSNALYELFGYFGLINVTIDNPEDDFPSTNEYRRVGIIMNPLNWSTVTIATALDLNACRQMIFSSGSGDFTVDDIANDIDEVITGLTSGAQGRMIDWDFVDTLTYIQTIDDTPSVPFVKGETIEGQFSESWDIGSLVNPEVQRYSGVMLYFENRVKIQRVVDQSETAIIVVDFSEC